MSFRTSFLKTVESIRRIAGPSGFDIRLSQITVRTRRWTGRVGIPPYTDSDLVLPQSYPVRQITGQEAFSSGGKYETDDLLVNHVTPSDGNGTGFSAEQLMPPVTTDDTEIIHILTGSHAGEYTCMDLRNFRPFTTQLVLRKRA